MFNDFLRAKRELKKNRSACLGQKFDHSLLHKKTGKTLFIITTNKDKVDPNNIKENGHNHNAGDHFQKQLPVETIGLSTGFKFRQPLLSSLKWTGHGQTKAGLGPRDNNWESEVENNALDSSILISYIRLLINRQANQLHQLLDNSDSEQEKLLDKLYYDTDQSLRLLEGESQLTDRIMLGNKTSEKCERIITHQDLLQKLKQSGQYDSDVICSIDNVIKCARETLYDETSGKEETANEVLNYIPEIVPEVDDSSHTAQHFSDNCEQCWHPTTTNIQESDFVIVDEEPASNDQTRSVTFDADLCVDDQHEDYNGYQEIQELGFEPQESPLSTDETADEELDNRIVYNTKPTGPPAVNTAVFVCCKALMKNDALQFGEQSPIGTLAADFNVNAVNKVVGDWEDNSSVESSTEEPQLNMEQDGVISGDTNDQENIIALTTSLTKCTTHCWSEILQTITSVANRTYPPGSLTLLLAALFIAIVIIITGNVLTFLAVMFDVLVHAALLSLLILVAVTVMEGNQHGNSSFSNQPSILSHFSCLLGSLTKSLQHSHDRSQSTNACIFGEQQDDICDKLYHDAQDNLDDSGIDMATSGSKSNIPSRGIKLTTQPAVSTSITYLNSTLLNHNSSSTQTSFAETMTETKSISSQTDPICEDEEATVNYMPMREECGDQEKPIVQKRDMESQANIDAQKIHDQIHLMQKRHQRNMRRLQIKFFSVRRNFHKQAGNLKFCDQQQGQFLAKLQLTLPALQKEKNRLSAEKVLFEKQYLDQRRKNQDLVSRIAKLNQQFQIMGQTHQPVVPTNRRLQHPNQILTSNVYRAQPQQDLQQQMKNVPMSNQQMLSTAAHLTMPQPSTLPCTPNKWMNSGLTQCPVFQPAPQSKPHHHHHQSRLPIFQMLYNSSTSLGNNIDEVSRLCKQSESLQCQNKPPQQADLYLSRLATSTSTSFQHVDPILATTRD